MAHNHEGVPSSTLGLATKLMRFQTDHQAKTRLLVFMRMLGVAKFMYTREWPVGAGCSMCGFAVYGCEYCS